MFSLPKVNVNEIQCDGNSNEVEFKLQLLTIRTNYVALRIRDLYQDE